MGIGTEVLLILLLARSLRLLSKVSSPAVSFIDGSTRLILKLLGTRPSKEPLLSNSGG